MAEEHLNTETLKRHESWFWLGDLLDQALWPLQNLVRDLVSKSEGKETPYDDLLFLMVPIMDTVEKNLGILDDVLNESLGHIKFDVTEHLRIYGGFRRRDFEKAYIPEAQAAPEGGEA